MSEGCSINVRHIAEIEARGFPQAQIGYFIDMGFRSVSAEEAEELLGFPIGCGGLYIPFNDGHFQIRPDKPYVSKDGKVCKYLSAKGSKARPWASPHHGPPVLVTEGVFDALAITLQTGISCAAIAGVNMTEGLGAFKETLEAIVYDADSIRNPRVLAALVAAGLKYGLQIGFFPPVDGDRKAGGQEWVQHQLKLNPNANLKALFNEGILDKCLEPEALLVSMPERWKELDWSAKEQDAAIEGVLRTAVKLGKPLVVDRLQKALSEHLDIRKDVSDKIVRDAQSKRKPSTRAKDPSGIEYTTKDRYAYQILFKNGRGYRTIKGVVHEWTGNHYTEVDDGTLKRLIATWGDGFCIDTSRGPSYPYQTSRAHVDVLNYLKARTYTPVDEVNPPGVNCQNGRLTISWDEGGPHWKLEHHSQAVCYTYCADYEYAENANPQHLDRLLAMFDPDQRELFLKTVSASLDMGSARRILDRDIRALWLWGDGSNGKDAARYALSLLFAEQGMTGVTLTDCMRYEMGHKFGLANLDHSRINWPSENSSFHKIDKIECLKAAINGMPIAIERKGKDIYETNINACFLFSGNEPPRIEAGSKAIASRFSVIHLRKVFGEGGLTPDPRFLRDREWVLKKVVPALLNRLLESLRSAVYEGIDHSAAQDDLQEARKSTSHLYQFMEDVGLVEDSEGVVTVREVWALLEQWYVSEELAYLDYGNYGEKTRLTFRVNEIFRGDKPVKVRTQLASRLASVAASVQTVRLSGKDRVTVLKGLTLNPKRGSDAAGRKSDAGRTQDRTQEKPANKGPDVGDAAFSSQQTYIWESREERPQKGGSPHKTRNYPYQVGKAASPASDCVRSDPEKIEEPTPLMRGDDPLTSVVSPAPNTPVSAVPSTSPAPTPTPAQDGSTAHPFPVGVAVQRLFARKWEDGYTVASAVYDSLGAFGHYELKDESGAIYPVDPEDVRLCPITNSEPSQPPQQSGPQAVTDEAWEVA